MWRNLNSINVYSLPHHRECPIIARSAEDLISAIDELIDADDEYCTYMSVFVIDREGFHVAYLGVGIHSDSGAGSILFQGRQGEYYTCGADSTCEAVVYFDFANERVFPGNSRINLKEIKGALLEFYADCLDRPLSVQWQTWSGIDSDTGTTSDLPAELLDPWIS